MTDSPEQEKPDRPRHGDPDLAGYLQQESPRRPTEPDAMVTLPTPDDVPPPESDMRDMEKSLVERIADVDDDRRRTAVQLRKALESHRDEIRAQRRRDHNAMLVLGGIGILLLAAGLLLFAQLVKTRGDLDARLAALEAQAESPATTDMTAEIDELADAVEAIGDRLTALEGAARRGQADGETVDTSAASESPGTAPDDLEGRVSALLDERLASLEARIDELRTDRRPPADASPAETAPAAEEEPAPPGTRFLTTEQDSIVLQLAGLPTRDAVQRFLARHALPGTVYLKVDSLRGRSWYGLIHSLHPSMEAAEAAEAALPEDLARLDIWLRPVTAGTRLEVLNSSP